MYNFEGSPPNYLLSVLGDELATDNIDTSAYYTPRDLSRIDYRIYWYGEVDVWLDYIRLDDEWAHFLFTDPNDQLPRTVNKYRFGEKIRTEVQALSNLPGFGYFYFDEFYYNNIPCLKEVLRLIKYYNPNAGIIFISPPAGFTGTGQGAGIKNELTLQEMYDYLNSQGLYVDFVANDAYPFFDDTPLPPNIRKPSPTEFAGTINYRNATSSGQYDDNVNTNVLSFRPIYQIDANLIKNDPNKVFVATIQAHTVETNFLYCPCNSIPNMERKREPTNEEISLQAFYAMAYGAKQIHYFTQFSGRAQKLNCPGQPWYYDWGLTNIEISGLQKERDTNYYGQHKWNYIQKLDSNLIKIGKFMYELNDLKYDNTISISTGERYKYISNLKSYFRNPSIPYEYSEINEDPANNTYWEVGFFNNSVEPYSKYFLLLNKRCVPEIIGGDGDLRSVKIYFNASELTGFNNWILKNPITNESVIFDKNNIANGVYIPGEFQPGEGRLYKIAPVMQEGGTFACDEDFSCYVNCKGNVFNNSKNLTIENGGSVYFAEDATIYMKGGRFKAGTFGDNVPNNIYFNKLGENRWKGLYFDTCSLIEVYSSNFLNIKANNYALNILNCNHYKVMYNNFSFTSDENCGGINATYAQFDNSADGTDNLYEIIANNNFYFNQSSNPCIEITSYAANIAPANISDNNFNHGNNLHSSSAILLEGVVGGTI